MPLDFFVRRRPPAPDARALTVGSQPIPVVVVRHPRARRYRLRVHADGSVRLTLPLRGSVREAWAFAERNIDWIARQLQQPRLVPTAPATWQAGTVILYRGEPVTLTISTDRAYDVVSFGDQQVRLLHGTPLRPAIEQQLWRLARAELPGRTFELAHAHAVAISRVTVRNQRSRWGSCSRKATISLNWRLIQAPTSVRDYIILHELMHQREMNHSARFWHHVATVCPGYREAERWLRDHRGLLR